MLPYQLAAVPPLTIGRGARRTIADLVAALVPAGSAILLVADPGVPNHAGAIADDLGRAGFQVHVFSDIKSDPSIAQAEAAAAMTRRSGARLVVSLGGGSALDLGKAVAATATADAPILDYALCATPLPPVRLGSICVPTTAGTGSETTRTAILSGPDGAKLWFWGDALKPDHAVLDPELAVTLPASLTAATGIDALVHAVEACTNRRANAGNDLYAHEAIRLVGRHLRTAVEQPDDLPAREGLARAAALAGTAIDNCGTAIAHSMGHAMASLRPMHHGRAVGVAMLATLPWTVANDPGGRFAACAAALGAEPTAQGFIDRYGALVRESGMRVGVAEDFTGVTPAMLADQMMRPENMPMIRSTRRDATPADLLDLAEAVLALR